MLTAADKRWIDFLSKTVIDSWDEANPSRPITMGYMGSEEFIRLQFEEYLLALLSCVKYHLYLQQPDHGSLPSVEGDPSSDFGIEWVRAWQQTPSFALFDKMADSHLFDIVEPRHPTPGNMNIEDVQRQINQQIQALHLDERLATSKEALNKHLATGQKKVSDVFNKAWADIEAMREAQKKRHVENKAAGIESSDVLSRARSEPVNAPAARSLTPRGPDLSVAQASVQAAGQKAGAYLSSWGSWASERKKSWAKQKDDGVRNEVAAAESKAPSPPKLSRWGSVSSFVSLGKGVKEEKGEDGIGRLDA